MGSLNPNLISADLTVIINEAVELARRYMKRNIYPELVLFVMIQHPEIAARRLMDVFIEKRGTDLEKLERQTRNAMESRNDANGDLDFLMTTGQKFPLSKQMLVALDEALSIAQSIGEVYIDSDHLLASLTDRRLGTGALLQQNGITEGPVLDLLGGQPASKRRREASGTSIDVVAEARVGNLRAVHFREDLLRDMLNILSQAVHKHIVLVGPDGVGKRTLAYSLALLITEGKGPVGLEKFVQIDEKAYLDNSVEAMQSGIMRAQGGILFVPHIHRFFGGPAKAEFPKAGQNLQKAFLGYDPIIICTTTQAEWEGRVNKVSAIGEHAQVLRVPEPTREETLEILEVMRPHLAGDYAIDVDESALNTAVDLAKRYIGNMPLPRSAEHLLHRAAALVSMNSQQHLAFRPQLQDNVLDAEDVTLAAAQMTGIPVSKLDADERTKYARMVEHLHERIVGQNDAVLAVSRAVKTARVGLRDPKRPIGSFLFLGPSGVGKTELARALAEFLFGSEDAMLQIDMSEYMEENTVSRLVGAPPGYVGYEGGGQLTDRVREQPYIVVLFDEVEKAHTRILDILLQVLEEGRLTDAQGKTANFSESVVILTSNLGAKNLQTSVVDEAVRELVMDDVRDHFRPEFLNRLDDIIIFHALDDEHLREIMELLLAREIKIARERGLNLQFTDKAVAWMLAQNDNPELGARPLKRIIQRYVRETLADFLLGDTLPPNATIVIDAKRDGLKFAVK